MQLGSKGPVAEEDAKWLQFPKWKRIKKKQDEHTDNESEKENQENTIRKLFQSPKGLKDPHNNNHKINPFT